MAFAKAAKDLWNERAAHRTMPWAVLLAVYLAASLSLRAYNIPTESMENTIFLGDRIVAESASWDLGRTPLRGDLEETSQILLRN